MKSEPSASRIEWLFLIGSLCLGLGSMVLSLFTSHDARTGSVLLPTAAAICGILAVLCLGLHMAFRFRRKMSARKRAKKEMADILA